MWAITFASIWKLQLHVFSHSYYFRDNMKVTTAWVSPRLSFRVNMKGNSWMLFISSAFIKWFGQQFPLTISSLPLDSLGQHDNMKCLHQKRGDSCSKPTIFFSVYKTLSNHLSVALSSNNLIMVVLKTLEAPIESPPCWPYSPSTRAHFTTIPSRETETIRISAFTDGSPYEANVTTSLLFTSSFG